MRAADRSSESRIAVLGSDTYRGVERLCRAWVLSQDAQRSPADFAVEMRRLQELGLTECDLRWLICKGYVEHFMDMTLPGAHGRVTQLVDSLQFSARSCFALTSAGIAFAERLRTRSPLGGREPDPVPEPNSLDAGVPRWLPETRQLCIEGVMIKEFRVPAPNQELILAAFEEEHWTPQIDDPLPPCIGVDCRMRLNKTVYRLNHTLHPPLIHFACGHGDSVRWERKTFAIGTAP